MHQSIYPLFRGLVVSIAIKKLAPFQLSGILFLNEPLEDTMINFFDALKTICDTSPDRFVANAYWLTFRFQTAVTTIRIIFEDEQTGADITISHMTTLPDSEKGNGHGSTALQKLISLALAHNLKRIHAVQVQDRNASFWKRNGFQKTGNSTHDYIYIPTGDTSL